MTTPRPAPAGQLGMLHTCKYVCCGCRHTNSGSPVCSGAHCSPGYSQLPSLLSVALLLLERRDREHGQLQTVAVRGGGRYLSPSLGPSFLRRATGANKCKDRRISRITWQLQQQRSWPNAGLAEPRQQRSLPVPPSEKERPQGLSHMACCAPVQRQHQVTSLVCSLPNPVISSSG